jgi:hypothetical protein
MPKTGTFCGREEDAPICLRTGLANPITPGKTREVRGFVISSLPARRTKQPGRGGVPAHRFPLCLSTARHLSRACPAGFLREGCGRTAFARSLSCPEYSSTCGGDGVATAVPTPSQPGRQDISTVHGGAGRDSRRSALPSSSGNYCAQPRPPCRRGDTIGRTPPLRSIAGSRCIHAYR